MKSYPELGRIDEVRESPVDGLYEVRIGTSIVYTDRHVRHVVKGEIIDTESRRNLTEERLNKLLAIDFRSLPFKDAFTITRGSGKREIAVFVDPNCGYCKKFEKELEAVEDVRIHVFLYPVLGADSKKKSQDIWCGSDRAGAWSRWMVSGVAPSSAPPQCDSSAVQRNIAFGSKYRVTGTPTLFFADGSRIPGAIDTSTLRSKLNAAASQ